MIVKHFIEEKILLFEIIEEMDNVMKQEFLKTFKIIQLTFTSINYSFDFYHI